MFQLDPPKQKLYMYIQRVIFASCDDSEVLQAFASEMTAIYEDFSKLKEVLPDLKGLATHKVEIDVTSCSSGQGDDSGKILLCEYISVCYRFKIVLSIFIARSKFQSKQPSQKSVKSHSLQYSQQHLQGHTNISSSTLSSSSSSCSPHTIHLLPSKGESFPSIPSHPLSCRPRHQQNISHFYQEQHEYCHQPQYYEDPSFHFSPNILSQVSMI